MKESVPRNVAAYSCKKNKKTKHHIITNGNRDEKHEVQAHLFGDTPEAVSAPMMCISSRGRTAEMSPSMAFCISLLCTVAQRKCKRLNNIEGQLS